MSADHNQPTPPPPEPTAPLPGQPAGPPPGGVGRSFRVIIAIVVAILVVAAVVAAIAFTGDEDEPATTSPTGVTTTTGATGPTQATGPTATGSTGATADTGSAANLGCPGGPPASETLPDGEYFGFVKSMNTATQTMAFDLACFYTGEEANQQAAARGDEVPVPNDVYIVNDNTKIRAVPFDPAAELKLIDWNQCCEFAPGAEMESFASAVDTRDFAVFDGFRYAGTLSPYWVTIEDGRAVAYEEQFLP